MSRISHKYKFIFFSYPKTGSTSVRSILDKYSDISATTYNKRTPENPFYSHITAVETKKIFKQKGWDYDSYFKFIFVRNPFSRMVSLYNMSTNAIPFNQWIMKVKNHGDGGYTQDNTKKWRIHGAYSLMNFVGDGKKLLVDRVIKLSDINIEFPKILQQLGIPFEHTDIIIPKINVGKYKHKKHWKTYYDQPSKKKVIALYGDDLINYNFTFTS
jgi:hypothetical protein